MLLYPNLEFCKTSAGIMLASWFSSFFENIQLLLDTERESEGGNTLIRSSWNIIWMTNNIFFRDSFVFLTKT